MDLGDGVNYFCISSVDANESFSRPVTVKQLVDMKHPVGVHVF